MPLNRFRRLRRFRLPLAALLLGAFVAASASSLAHDIEHALERHADQACPLHLYAGNKTGLPVPAIGMPAPLCGRDFVSPAATTFVAEQPSHRYLARAPPR